MNRPLADQLRPSKLAELVGQEHLTQSSMPLARMLASRRFSSIIFWGPPGCGKTTLARILARESGLHFEHLSAIFSGVKDLKRLFEEAKARFHEKSRSQAGNPTLLFVDEIHRFMKSQQDAFLPVVEDGTIILIGATTENPSFELNSALLSRCQVMVLKRLNEEALEKLLSRAEESQAKPLPLTQFARALLITLADGDGRYLLTLAEQLYAMPDANPKNPVDSETLMSLAQRRAPLYDKHDEGHYNLISALHKSVRGSDPDAALYWFSRMLSGGEDPHFIARRMTRMASEDIGLADPYALTQCINAWQAYERLGSPEGELALAQALVYLATAPKSVAVYTALKAAQKSAKKTGSHPPPKHILNAPKALMKKEGYSEGYIYDPDTPHSFSGQEYFPNEMQRQNYYHPAERGFEREIQKRLAYWEKLRQQFNQKRSQ